MIVILSSFALRWSCPSPRGVSSHSVAGVSGTCAAASASVAGVCC